MFAPITLPIRIQGSLTNQSIALKCQHQAAALTGGCLNRASLQAIDLTGGETRQCPVAGLV